MGWGGGEIIVPSLTAAIRCAVDRQVYAAALFLAVVCLDICTTWNRCEHLDDRSNRSAVHQHKLDQVLQTYDAHAPWEHTHSGSSAEQTRTWEHLERRRAKKNEN